MTKAIMSGARAHLGGLVDAALRGERVVILRRAKPAVAIVPATRIRTPKRLRISEAAATYLVREARAELRSRSAKVAASPDDFGASLTKPRRRV